MVPAVMTQEWERTGVITGLTNSFMWGQVNRMQLQVAYGSYAGIFGPFVRGCCDPPLKSSSRGLVCATAHQPGWQFWDNFINSCCRRHSWISLADSFWSKLSQRRQNVARTGSRRSSATVSSARFLYNLHSCGMQQILFDFRFGSVLWTQRVWLVYKAYFYFSRLPQISQLLSGSVRRRQCISALFQKMMAYHFHGSDGALQDYSPPIREKVFCYIPCWSAQPWHMLLCYVTHAKVASKREGRNRG